MPIDISSGSFAAATIKALFWWTVLSPVALLGIAALCDGRPRPRAALTIAALVPPVVTLLPVAVMRGGPEAFAAAAAVLILAAAMVLAVASLVRRHDPAKAEQCATAAFLTGVAGGMVGSAALVGALLFG